MRPTRALLAATAAVLVVGLAQGGPAAERRRPRDAAEVVARVPSRRADPDLGRIAALERRLAADPRDASLAAGVARLLIEEARRRSDPRYLGRAEAALAPWWELTDPPDAVQLLRATLRQTRHEFLPALADLDRLVARSPGDAQAQLSRAVVLTVLGRYAPAIAGCDALERLTARVFWAACRAPILARTGRRAEAIATLRAALAGAGAAERAWGESILGEIDYWAGRPEAEAELRSALAADADDVYTRGVLADLLLDEGRAPEAKAVLAGREANDGLLLRLVLAEVQLGERDAAARASLVARFDAARRRGDSIHQREEARLAVAAGDPGRALALARAGFEAQREPWDVRLLLEAALAARDPAAAAPARAWLAETHFDSPRLGAR
ncbi:MAG TPA: hypothetical protein VKE22_19725 [Haliangiales bacterium]|nr:hypothetical protein [Haliangiales bacterium]